MRENTYTIKEIKKALEQTDYWWNYSSKKMDIMSIYDWFKNELVQQKRYKRMAGKRKPKQI